MDFVNLYVLKNFRGPRLNSKLHVLALGDWHEVPSFVPWTLEFKNLLHWRGQDVPGPLVPILQWGCQPKHFIEKEVATGSMLACVCQQLWQHAHVLTEIGRSGVVASMYMLMLMAVHLVKLNSKH